MTDRTKELYRDDSYLKSCDATVVEITDRGALVLDRTVFYYTGGGQPGDSGTLTFDGGSIRIGTTIQADGDILHIPEEGQTLPPIGTKVVVE
jgi:misacylated tRNA(Ala) deacylase